MTEWKAVPVTPTEEMRRDMVAELKIQSERAATNPVDVYQAALALAPDTHVAVKRMTVEEAKDAWVGHPELPDETLPSWLAALRWAGVIKEGE